MRRFELLAGTSSKFWEIEVQESTVLIRFGRIGAAGQTREKRFGDAAGAQKEADKLIREKQGKGYIEQGTTAAREPRSQDGAAPPKREPAVPKKLAPVMPVPGLDDPHPGAFAFTARLDELYAAGWPEMVLLTDVPIEPKIASRQAVAALQAIDPYLPTVMPRDLARRMLLGAKYHPFEQVSAIRKAVASHAQVDDALLREVLKEKYGRMHKGSETYPFRMATTVFLFEAFLGTEHVAQALVDHFGRGLKDLSLWGSEAFFIDHQNANFRRLTTTLGWLRLRMPPATWHSLVAPLREGNPKLPLYSAALGAIADDRAPIESAFDTDALALQRGDVHAARASCARRFPFDYVPRFAYLVGADLLLSAPESSLLRSPKWYQERLIAELGTIRAPGTLRAMAVLLRSRSVARLAASWLEGRRDWVQREGIPALQAFPGNEAHEAAVRVLLEGGREPTAPSKAQLETELARVFAALPEQMHACRDDLDQERAVMTAAFQRYCEIRAALDEVIPEAYFTHQLDLAWNADEARITRWIDTAVDIA